MCRPVNGASLLARGTGKQRSSIHRQNGTLPGVPLYRYSFLSIAATLYMPQPFPHMLRIRMWLIIANAVPGLGNMQFVGLRLGDQDLSSLLWRDQGAAGAIACHQEQRTMDGSQDLERRAFAGDGCGAGMHKIRIELAFRDGPLLDCDL